MPCCVSKPWGRRAVLLLVLVTLVAPVRAATLERLTLSDMISKSTAIVRAQVTGTSAAFHRTVIYTHYRIKVLNQWKGSSQTSLDVLVPGGVANGVRQTYAGAPELTVGQEYVLFLWTSRTGATYTLGFTQGVFSLPKDASGRTMAVRAPTTETLLEPQTGKPLKDKPIRMPLEQLVSIIKAGGAAN